MLAEIVEAGEDLLGSAFDRVVPVAIVETNDGYSQYSLRESPADPAP